MRELCIHFFLFLFISLFPLTHIYGQKTDPYHLDSGGFGTRLEKDGEISVWWCEGAYKVMLDTPVPSLTGDTISLWSASNEYEPFQLVIRTETDLDSCRISVSDLISGGHSVDAQNIEIRRLEYVKVTKPTDSYGYAGLWPDPLPAIDGPLTVHSGENTTFWLTLFVPAGTVAGIYNGSVILESREWKKEIPVRLTVWDFELPEETSLRSGFGLSVDKIAAYHNLEREAEIKHTFDLYMQSFREYKIAPYDPFYLYPIKEKVTGPEWEGGIYDYDNSYNGEYSLMIEDDSRTEDIPARYKRMIPVNKGIRYNLRWNVKAADQDQQYCILLEGFNKEGDKLVFENKLEAFECDSTWESRSFTPGIFGNEVSHIRLSVFPVFRTASGEEKGTIWIDNISFSEAGGNENLISQGDFEIEPGDTDIELDFTDFDKAGERYLDEFGFNSFRLYLKGMGSGTYFSRNKGVFEGFVKGSPVYKHLMDKYLRLMEKHLDEKGWLGKEYVYWFDEPAQLDYPFVREGMETIKRSAPRINTFLTENDPGPGIMDVTDITCTIFHRVDPEDVKKINSMGQEYWSYLCTAPKAPWVSEFIDHDAINLRMWLWITYAWDLNGILIWSTNYWTSRSASPPAYLQNPWKEPASYVQGYGWPYGKQTNWGNGDGRFFYPPNKNPNTDRSTYIAGPVPSIRLEFLRQGIEDYEYLVLLENMISIADDKDRKLLDEAGQLLQVQGSLFTDGKTYTKDPVDILQYRKRVAEMIIKLKKQMTGE